MIVNIEGGEFDLIQALYDSGLIRNIREIHIQAHDTAGINLINSLAIVRRSTVRVAFIKTFSYLRNIGVCL